MKPVFLILYFSFTLTAIGQTVPDNEPKGTFHIAMACDDSGFTNKAEAKNLKVNGLKEGKWIEYFNSERKNIDNNVGAVYYCLAMYNAGKPCGLQRYYQMNGILREITPMNNGKRNGIVKDYYENGKILGTFPFKDGKIEGVVKTYYENGKLKSEETNINDSVVATRSYDKNGNEIK
jgi:antitoxin component YwqK of YwqJK toxin-antitoxin module